MWRTSKTLHVLIFSALGAVVASGVYGWLVMRVLEVNAETALLANTINTQVMREEHVRSAEDLLEATVVERQKLSSFFVTEESVVVFIETLEMLGRDADVRVTIATVDAEDKASDDRIGSVRVRLVAVGAWRDVVHFTALIDSLPFATTVSAASFDQPSAEKKDEWRGSFTLRVGLIK